jgi:ResB protein required for cytochrome c biosynthesis
MWKQPWGLKEGFAICGGLFLTGTLLQFTIGKINWDLLSFPVNIILLSIYIAILIAMRLTSKKIYLFKWMSQYPAAITAMIGVVAVTVIMGLIRQKPFQVEVVGFESWLGFSQMLSAWPFVLLYIWFTTLVGLVTIRRITPFRLRNIPFLLNHAGLFIAITGAVLGSADMQRLELTASIGAENPEWRAYNKQGELKELSLAIKLNEFSIEEYPPKLMLIDNETGKALPESKPVNLLLEEDFCEGDLLNWHIAIKQHIPEAASMATEDTLRFVEFHSMGAAYAVYLEAKNTKTGEKKEGWVSGGSFMFPYKAIRLTEQMSIVIPEREPRKYASDVTIYTQEGETHHAVIEVNKPFEVDGWKIYQLNYDQTKGKWSTVSVFELVRDPWITVVYTGIWMLIVGALCMFLTAGKTRKEEKE